MCTLTLNIDDKLMEELQMSFPDSQQIAIWATSVVMKAARQRANAIKILPEDLRTYDELTNEERIDAFNQLINSLPPVHIPWKQLRDEYLSEKYGV